jgi:hypothetical protein
MVTAVKAQIDRAHVFLFFPKLIRVIAETDYEISFFSTFASPFPHHLKNFIIAI